MGNQEEWSENHAQQQQKYTTHACILAFVLIRICVRASCPLAHDLLLEPRLRLNLPVCLRISWCPAPADRKRAHSGPPCRVMRSFCSVCMHVLSSVFGSTQAPHPAPLNSTHARHTSFHRRHFQLVFLLQGRLKGG